MTTAPKASRPIIAVDIDDVLSTHAKDFVAYSNKRWSTNLTVDDYDEHWAKMWRVDDATTEQRAKELHSSGVVGTYGHIAAAKPVLQELRQSYRLVVITSRRRVLMKETTDWLQRYFDGVFEAVHYAGLWDELGQGAHAATKASMALGVGAHYLIDDQVKHCVGAAKVGLQALLFGDYSWNRSVELPEGVTRVSTWQEVREYFRGRQ